jgi:hypothetical protein
MEGVIKKAFKNRAILPVTDSPRNPDGRTCALPDFQAFGKNSA